MIIKKFKKGENDSWMSARMGKITGSKVKGVLTLRGNTKKVGFYELVAERLAIPEAGGLSPIDRGSYLESEALERFQEETGKVVIKEKVLWIREDNQNIAISPDGVISMKEACEVKCLNSARHVQALLTQEVPDEYWGQALQYFVVNDELEVLYFIFFDPRMTVKEFFYLEIKREDISQQIEAYMKMETDTLKEVDSIVSSLSEF